MKQKPRKIKRFKNPLKMAASKVERSKLKSFSLESGFHVRGRYEILTLHPKPEWVPQEEWLKMIRNGQRPEAIKRRTGVIENLIMLAPDVGLNLIMQHLSGDTTFPLEIDQAAIGTGNTAPTSGDTGLETPVVTGIPRAIGELTDDATFYSEWFITNDELPNDTYEEFALYCGSQIFARSIISGPTYTKDDNEDTLVVYSIVVSNT